jgi:hypothetical protein
MTRELFPVELRRFRLCAGAVQFRELVPLAMVPDPTEEGRMATRLDQSSGRRNDPNEPTFRTQEAAWQSSKPVAKRKQHRVQTFTGLPQTTSAALSLPK